MKFCESHIASDIRVGQDMTICKEGILGLKFLNLKFLEINSFGRDYVESNQDFVYLFLF